MKKELDVEFSVGKSASEIMEFLRDNKDITFAQALDALSLALVVSAFSAGVSKKEFMENTNSFWDNFEQEVSDKKQSLH